MTNITFLDGSIGQDFSGVTGATFTMEWAGPGGRIDGRGCEIDLSHIAELARRLRDAGHSLV